MAAPPLRPVRRCLSSPTSLRAVLVVAGSAAVAAPGASVRARSVVASVVVGHRHLATGGVPSTGPVSPRVTAYADAGAADDDGDDENTDEDARGQERHAHRGRRPGDPSAHPAGRAWVDF